MIQFNLLPDIKQKYLKAQRQKHLVVFISVIASIAAISILVILVLVVDLWQKKSLSDLNNDIKTDSSQLAGTQDLNKILTVQNQLKSLTSLHDKKAVASRLFAYIAQLTPANATIAKVDVDYNKNTIVINGSADTIHTVNIFSDTLKFTTYSLDSSKATPTAFSNVVLTTFGRSATGATYTINASFDPAIFSEAHNVTLTVPNTTTTRSVIDQPTEIFKNVTPTPTN